MSRNISKYKKNPSVVCTKPFYIFRKIVSEVFYCTQVLYNINIREKPFKMVNRVYKNSEV